MPLSPLSSYPGGFAGGVIIRELPLATTFAGNVYWVSSTTGSDGNRGTRERPFATLAYAISRCTASQGDAIFIAPSHAETITSATALPFNVAGITIIGLGTGSVRPTFTFTTANTAKIPVSAANITIQNCIFVGNFLSIATCFLLTTAPEFWVDRCEFRDTSAVLGFLSIITTTVSVNSDGLKFTSNVVHSDATTTPGPAIVVANTMNRLTISGNTVIHTVASDNVSALLAHGALVVSRALITDNFVWSPNSDTATGGILITTSATTGSGIVARNVARTVDTAAAILVTVTAVQYAMYDNKHIDGATFTSGYLLPAIGAD